MYAKLSGATLSNAVVYLINTRFFFFLPVDKILCTVGYIIIKHYVNKMFYKTNNSEFRL